VDRNRIKRRMREAVRLERPTGALPVDIVINPKKSALKADFSALRQEVARAFELVQQKLAEKPRRAQER
jgi:ribonuclease P protein component